MLSNFDLMRKMGDKIKGVYCKDELEGIRLFPGESIIINLDDSSGGGTHWVCLYKDKDIEYFDSFGQPPPDKIVDLMRKQGGVMKYNTLQVQHPLSEYCGWYCMNYINDRLDKKSMYDTIHKFNIGDRANEKMLK